MRIYRFFLFILLSGTALTAYSQPGLDEMGQVGVELSGWYLAMVDFSFALSAILGICGAIKIFYNWQMGKPNTFIAVSAWFFAALFLLLSGVFIRALMGV